MESGIYGVAFDSLPNGFPGGQIADTAAQPAADGKGHKGCQVLLKLGGITPMMVTGVPSMLMALHQVLLIS